MHNEKLIIFVEIRLWHSLDRAPIKTGNNLRSFIYAERDKPIAQIAERLALYCAGEFISLQYRTGIDPCIHVVNRDADWNILQ